MLHFRSKPTLHSFPVAVKWSLTRSDDPPLPHFFDICIYCSRPDDTRQDNCAPLTLWVNVRMIQYAFCTVFNHHFFYVSVVVTGGVIPLLVDYKSPRISTTQIVSDSTMTLFIRYCLKSTVPK
jgi:hypothetical protein